MVAHAGDNYYADGNKVTVESDGTGSAGDVVEWSSGQVTQMAGGSSGTIFGVLAEDSPDSAGEDVLVYRGGAPVANVDSGTSAGELGVSASNAGSLASGSAGVFALYDEGEESEAGTAPVSL